jgi:hypothetical protein
MLPLSVYTDFTSELESDERVPMRTIIDNVEIESDITARWPGYSTQQISVMEQYD